MTIVVHFVHLWLLDESALVIFYVFHTGFSTNRAEVTDRAKGGPISFSYMCFDEEDRECCICMSHKKGRGTVSVPLHTTTRRISGEAKGQVAVPSL